MTDTAAIIIPFGKLRGVSLDEADTGYLTWMLKKERTCSASDRGVLARFVRTNRDAIELAITGAGRRAAESFITDYTLNASQQGAVDTIVAELINGETPTYRLEGGAGYGKSFATIEIVRQALLAGLQVRACATSYVATQVLASQLATLGVEAKTMASTLRLAKIENEDREEYVLSERTGDAIAELLGFGNLLIVDEYSMVEDTLGRQLLDGAEAFGGKLLAIGDLHQLPPVKQSRDSILATIPGSVELTEPMRYGRGSDLFKLEQILRHTPESFVPGLFAESDSVTVHDTGHDMVAAFVADMHADPRGDARMLFYRRADVLAANAKIRAGYFGTAEAAASPIIDDERLMVMSTTDVDLGGERPVRFYSGQTFLVEQVSEGMVPGTDIPCYWVKFADRRELVPVIFASGVSATMDGMRGSAEFAAELAERRAEAKETGQWGEFYKLAKAVLTVGYNYAMTVHRCQGQTVDRCYFNPAALTGPQGRKLLYVAGTRAKRHVHLVA